MTAPQWPLDDLVARLRALHDIAANEAADVLAAVAVALDEYDHLDLNERGIARVGSAMSCVSAIREVVGR